MTPVQHSFQAEVSQVLRLVIHSLYGNKEIFLRELVSNASDALDRRRFSAIQHPELLSADETLKVRLIPDPEAGTLTLWDNGIGMTEEELKQNLGTIAWSGSRDFAERIKKAESSGADLPSLIGQFGVGFYSSYLVADRVSVVSRAAGSESAHLWQSTGEEGFTLEPTERESVGTSVTLHLKPEQKEFLDPHRLRALVERYSDYLAHSIELPKAGESEAFEAINRASALWKRPAKELEKAQYVEFYKHLTHDWEEPIAYRHFHIEGTQEFTGLLFLPSRPPLDLFDTDQRHGVRLHVRRVFVMDDCAELVPRFLRFVRGVIDSEDLPLNVSREILQDSRIVHVIRKQVIHQVLELLSELANERSAEYLKFYRAFGAVLKEGLHFEPEHKDKLAKLVRYESTAQAGLISLDEYLASMPEGQPAIYYVTGLSRAVAASSPHLERVRAKGYDVLLLTDPVDSFVMDHFDEYQGKRLVSVTSQNLSLDEAKSDQEPASDSKSASLLERFKEVLKGNVAEVRASTRLIDSPACLVTPEGGLPPHMERLLRAQKRDLPATRRILELNLDHPLVKSVERLELVEPGSERGREWMELIHEQALLAEGSPIEDPAEFAKKLTKLMTLAAEHELSAPKAS